MLVHTSGMGMLLSWATSLAVEADMRIFWLCLFVAKIMAPRASAISSDIERAPLSARSFLSVSGQACLCQR